MNKILVVDDEKLIRNSFVRTLRYANFSVIAAPSGREALRIIKKERPDVILLDLKMPDMNGIETLQKFKDICPNLPVIIITAYGDIQTAVNAIKAGAYDFILKPPDFDMLILTLKRAIERYELQKKLDEMSSGIESSMEYLLGKSPAIKKVIAQIQQVAMSNFSLLIQGETGTGKSFVANVIHNLSKRRKAPYISVDMGAIPETLVESELFGYERGAFTGAEKKKSGFFEMANGGTIVIDELQNISYTAQSKLLRAVEDKRIHPLGGTESAQIDVRIIGITNASLRNAVEDKKFREDLFYRLSEVTILIPPLRERKEDIAFFAQKFLVETCEELNRNLPEISEDAQGLLDSYPWPGNLRELKNVIRASVLFSSEGAIRGDNIACLLRNEEGNKNITHLPVLKDFLLMPLNAAENILIRKTLEFTGGNKTRAAALLQIDYKTLLRKIRHYGI